MVETIYNFFNKPLKKYNKNLKKIEIEYNKIKNEKNIDKNLDLLKDKSIYEILGIIKFETKNLYNISIHDVQMIGAMIMLDGNIVEMKTGEGKTLTSIIASLVFSIKNPNKKVHIVSVNDYLVKRDYEDYKDLVLSFNISHTFINESVMDWERKEEYSKQIIHITNNELGFDYLRDNMVSHESELRNNNFDFIIVDEADSIMIDEARDPLVISGDREEDNRPLIQKINDIVISKLINNTDFEINKKDRTVLLTDDGIDKIEDILKIDNLYTHEHLKEIHYIDQTLNAHYLQENELEYLIKDGKVLLIDSNTGRISENRRLSNGLHQCIEAKEGLEIEKETQTMASITYQNLIRKYDIISGMTGTAETEKEEFQIIYGSEVIVVPPNVKIKRKDLLDQIYITEEFKFNAILNKIKEISKKGQPMLIGTASVDKSELLSKYLIKNNIEHSLLNAKNHEQEAEIIEKAGVKGNVTIATNMAGRGVDIKINKEVEELGGLYVLGTERHESRRIDNQLRGRSGRQGDNGISQFYISLEDNLVQIFGGDKLKNFIVKISNNSEEVIESSMISRSIEKAQKQIEQIHFDGRKDSIEYDDVINEQRNVVYDFRMKLIKNEIDIIERLEEMNKTVIENDLNKMELNTEEDFIEGDHEKIIKYIEDKFKIDMEGYDSNKFKDIDETLIIILKLLKDEEILKFKDLDQKDLNSIYKKEYINIIDKKWKNLLYEIDSVKTGIRLRAYSNKDPLSEYKKETHKLFLEMIYEIKQEVVYLLNLLYLKEKNIETIDNKEINENKNIEKNKNLSKLDLLKNYNRNY